MKKKNIIGLLSTGVIAGFSLIDFTDKNGYTSANAYLSTKSNSNTINEEATFTTQDSYTTRNSENKSSDYLYLSDIPISSSKVGWGSLSLDKSSSNTALTLYLNGSYVTFDKGIFAHATSTIIYDISKYKEYDYFTTYYGVNQTSGNKGNGVKFYIYTSVDGITWDLRTEQEPPAKKSANEASYVKIDIKTANYIKLYAYDNGANGNDHSIWADSKLVKANYNENVTKTVEEYDSLIKAKYTGGELDEELELLVLQRELVNKIGVYQLKKIVTESAEMQETFDWLFNDLETLRLYMAGGIPSGTYLRSFEVLKELRSLYKDDLSSTGITENGNKLSTIYKKMMITLSLTHSTTVNFWVSSNPPSGQPAPNPNPNISSATNRYAIYKDMLTKGKLRNAFEVLEVEEMRYVMNSMINDDEIEWLIDLSKTKSNPLSGYSYMSYINVNTALYRNDRYYGENRINYETKYRLTGYDVVNEKYYPRLWMIMDVGGVCWQISNVGQNVSAALGLPSLVVGQPGHSAYISYRLDANGNGLWDMWNDVGGWNQTNQSAYAGSKGYYAVRYLNGWGNGSYASSNNGTYMMLGAAAMNDYTNYVKALELNILANVYEGDNASQEKIYRSSLKKQSFNFDSWLKLVQLYSKDTNKTDKDRYALAEELASSLKYYPLPMYDLFRLLSKSMTEPAYIAKLYKLESEALTTATTATDAQVLQSGIAKNMAKYLLGLVDNSVADFSFDGENAGKIWLSSKYENSNAGWDYSLDGGKTWSKQLDVHSIDLTDEEIKSITSATDIKVHILGVDYSPENIYTIDIKESEGIPTNVYANDWENKIIGHTDTMEWKYNENDGWNSYKQQEPDLKGDKKITIRMGATGHYLPSASITYTFTKKDEDNINKSYVSIEHLSIDSFSTENVRSNRKEFEYAKNTIDGNINTWWHTDRTSTTDERFIVIKLDEPRYISELQYIPVQNYNYGVLKDGIISMSIDGTSWEDIYTISDLPKNNDVKTFTLNESIYTQYIKIKCTHSYDYLNSKNADWFLSASMFNIFEDLSKNIPTASIEYSRTSKTGLPVTAHLVTKNNDIIITNNNGKDTYTFDKNGEFIFEFEDKFGNKGSAKAVVDWIIDYSFSLDGEDPYKIILGNAYSKNEWEYSIDGGITWKQTTGTTYTLSADEIEMLSAEKDLKIRLLTESDNEQNEIITFDILDSEQLPTNLYANDWENEIIGVNDMMEWKLVDSDTWVSYKDQKPDLHGNKTIEVRTRAHDLTLKSQSQTFTFTSDGEDDLTHVYIPKEHLSIADFSSESPNNDEYAQYAIDGRIDTKWHTNHETMTDDRYIVIKLDKPMYISQVQYVPYNGYPWGIMNSGIIYSSVDGTNWNEEYTVSGLTNEYSVKTFTFANEAYAQYIKIKCTSSYDGANSNSSADWFFNAAMINLFQDTTIKHETVVKAIYNTEKITNTNVEVSLISTNSEITITNNNGLNKYTFTENGEFTFEYTDEYGNKGSYKAIVDWIDKKSPTGKVNYNPQTTTNSSVTATLTTDEEVTITNNEGKSIYTFTDNGTFTFEFIDKAGNKGSTTAVVDWIDKTNIKAEIEYSTTTLTDKNVIATLKTDKKVTILNNNNKNTYTFTENGEFTFEYVDESGTHGNITAKVDWIKKVPQVEIEYSNTSITGNSVIATIISNQNIKIKNNNGKNNYTFTENGSFIFIYEDEYGEEHELEAKVNWIDKNAPTAEISYDISNLTNKDVIAKLVNPSKKITITNNDGKDTYTFTKNGYFTFEYIDEIGNIGSTTAHVDWIDKEKPIAQIKYNINFTTNQNVTATLEANEDIIITNNNGNKNYTFTKNGKFTFEYIDVAGNQNTTTAIVDWIDKEPPLGTIRYDITEYTKSSVTATLNTNEDVSIINNDGKNTYTFNDNGEFTFEFVDEAGNKGTKTAHVDWIYKNTPSLEITYDNNTMTNKDVTATLEIYDGITVVNNDGKNTYTFTKNGEFIFEYEDAEGNKGSAKAIVDWIDKEIPVANVSYDVTSLTNGNVVATLVDESEPITILDVPDGSYTFTKNGSYTFTFKDKVGNIGNTTAYVDWIDKENPMADIEYSETKQTENPVIVTLKPNEEIRILNNGGKESYIFDENGEFTFEFIDKAGNKGTKTARVNWIKKTTEHSSSASKDIEKNKNEILNDILNKKTDNRYNSYKGKEQDNQIPIKKEENQKEEKDKITNKTPDKENSSEVINEQETKENNQQETKKIKIFPIIISISVALAVIIKIFSKKQK